jgi:diaminopimelate decarboxylase
MDMAVDIRKSIIGLLESSQGDLATPAYIYSVEQVGKNYRDLKEELGTPLVVSIKANHCPELLSRTAYSFEDGCEFASLGELRLRAGTRRKIYINSPAYSKKLVEVACRYDATFIIDDVSQLDIIADVKQQQAFNSDVLMRLNFDAVLKGADAQPHDHFGMDEKTLFEAIAKAKDLNVKVAGLHIFCGSNGFMKKAGSCVGVVEKLFDTVSAMLGYPLETLNLGGGIPVDWRERNIDFKSYRESLTKLKEKANVIHESGRAIFGSAGYFVTEVVAVKSINNKNFVVCDGGITQNFLLAKTEHVIRKYDRPTIISKSGAGEVSKNYTFVGASCNRDDVIGEVSDSPYELKAGDKVMFSNCGAYNSVYTVNKFLALKEFKEYIV